MNRGVRIYFHIETESFLEFACLADALESVAREVRTIAMPEITTSSTMRGKLTDKLGRRFEYFVEATR